MQDNTSSHASKYTREGLEKLGIQVEYWPAFSPDLNMLYDEHVIGVFSA